jgi:DNA excision repair protein ERCC-6-like 2
MDDVQVVNDTDPSVIDLELDSVVNSIPRDEAYLSTSDEESRIEESFLDEPQQHRRRMKKPVGPSERLEWSSDEQAGNAYLAFKNRKTLKRKRAAAEGAKTRAARAGKPLESKPSRSSTGVGRREPKKKRRRGKDWGGTSEDEDELLDEVLPDYIKNRKSKFDEKRDQLGEAGLKLPPSYEDIYFSEDERMDRLREKPQIPNMKPPARYEDIFLEHSLGTIPAPIAQWLRDYQVKGVEFLHKAFVYQRGAILGDDMGLGKTVQVIAFLTAAFGKTGDERDARRMRKIRRAGDGRWYPRILLVCPGSVMENWKAELDRWGWWAVDMYHGSEKEAALQAAVAGRLEILITTYATYRTNMGLTNTVDWDCIIADECHILKSQSSDVTKAMNNVNALCRIGLTGTAIQNSYNELWTLLNWANPGVVGSLSAWKHAISEPLRIGQAHDASSSELATARRTANLLVKNLLPQFFLRRMKSLIADQLPKKTDRVVFCPLTDTQADAYENFIDSDTVQCIQRSTELCDCDSGKRRGWCHYAFTTGGERWQTHVFPAIVTLQKLSNHIALLLPSTTESVEKQMNEREKLEITLPHQWQDLMRQKDSITNFANPEFCGKWRVLKKLLQFWHNNGDKVLVFSHSVRLLKMLQILFTSTTTYNVSYLDGKMNYVDRQKAVNDFNLDPGQFVFLISTRAGGVGLNITSANKVVVVDPNWNPSYDLQAQDRAYRIGQTRDVEVFRLISAGTIEEIVYARQIYKQQQANIGYNASLERRYFKGVQDLKEKKGEIFGLQNLFAYQHDNVVLQGIVNKTNVAESKAGVLVTDVDMSQVSDEPEDSALQGDEDSQNRAMSQLAKLIESGGQRKKKSQRPKKMDAVQAILASAGVEYTHENSEVIGTSKIESRLSKRAMEGTATGSEALEPVFAASQGDQTTLKIPASRNSAGVSSSDPSENEETLEVSFRYRPPEDVRKRQFCTMARTFGFNDATEFALVVESWTQEQRRNCLEKFYRIRRREILGIEKSTKHESQKRVKSSDGRHAEQQDDEIEDDDEL